MSIIDKYIDEIEPHPTPQRFGNSAFREFGDKLENNIDDLLKDLLNPDDHRYISQIKPMLLNSFGSFGRIDYGTGHETSFICFLLNLNDINYFNKSHYQYLVSKVFTYYFNICTKSQCTYKLEPAGSHGVWGLDDYSFFPYIFGSSQIKCKYLYFFI